MGGGMVDTYYDEDGITIYHADNADVEWPDPSDVGLLITDPPYGIGYTSWVGESVVGDDTDFDPNPLLAYNRLVIWGANYFAHQLGRGGWFVWSKRQDNKSLNQYNGASSNAEVAWTNLHERVYLFNYFWAGGPFLRGAEERGKTLHPTQKPVPLMRWIIDKWTDPGDLIFDPYMGSGPVARACLDLGRRYVGIEIVEEYCQAAVNRLGQLALALDDG